MILSNLVLSTILFIGDSHSVGPFGQALDLHLREKFTHVATATSCGTIARDWYQSSAVTKCGYREIDTDGTTRRGTEGPVPSFTQLLQRTRPDHVIVALATNYANYPDESFIVADMRRMAQEIVRSGARCYWVGMPTSRTLKDRHEKVDRLTRQAVRGLCQFFDSFTVTSYPATGGDGIHFYFPGGREMAADWGKAVFEDFQTRVIE
jgi:hypothetical protein